MEEAPPRPSPTEEDEEDLFEREISQLYASALGRLGPERAAEIARRALSSAAATAPAISPIPTADDAAPAEEAAPPNVVAAAGAKSLAAAAAARAISLPAPATDNEYDDYEEDEGEDAAAATAANARPSAAAAAAAAPPPPPPSGRSSAAASSLWQRAVSLASRPRREADDPWAARGVHRRPLERGRRYRYRSETGRWAADDVLVRMDPLPFAAGAMRECWAVKKASTFGGAGGGALAIGGGGGGAGANNNANYKKKANGAAAAAPSPPPSSLAWPNFVAKRYKNPSIPDAVYVADCVMQMDAKALGEAYNRAFAAGQEEEENGDKGSRRRPPRGGGGRRPPRSVDVLQVSLLRLPDRPSAPLFAIEDAIQGDYCKYNSNSGAVLFGLAARVGGGLSGSESASDSNAASASASNPSSRLRLASFASRLGGGGALPAPSNEAGASPSEAAACQQQQHHHHHHRNSAAQQQQQQERQHDVLRNTPQAFSHFTYAHTQGRRIVTDVQGVADLYTDPQVHSLDGRGYGDGNLGLRGVALFFRSHECNPLCARLRLAPFRRCPTDVRAQGYRVAAAGGGLAGMTPAAERAGAAAAAAAAATPRATPAAAADDEAAAATEPSTPPPLPPVAELGATMTRSFLEHGRSSIIARLASARARDRATPRLLASLAVAEGEDEWDGSAEEGRAAGDEKGPGAAGRSLPRPLPPPAPAPDELRPPLLAVPLLPAPADAHVHWELARYYAEVVVLPETRPKEDPDQALLAGLFHLEQAAELGAAQAQALLARAHCGVEPSATSLAVLVASAAARGVGFARPSPELAWRYALLAGARGVPSAAAAVAAALEAAAVAAMAEVEEEEDEGEKGGNGNDNKDADVAIAACAAAAAGAPPPFRSALWPADQAAPPPLLPLLIERDDSGGDYSAVVFFGEEEEEGVRAGGSGDGNGSNGGDDGDNRRRRRRRRRCSRLLAAADAWYARAEAARAAVGRAEAYRRRLKEEDEAARAAALATGAGGPEDQPIDEAAAAATTTTTLASALSLGGVLRSSVPPAWEREAREEAAALLDDGADGGRPLPCDPLFATQAEDEASALLSVAAAGGPPLLLLEARARVALLRGLPARAAELLYAAAEAAEEAGMGKRAARLYERAGEAEGLSEEKT